MAAPSRVISSVPTQIALATSTGSYSPQFARERQRRRHRYRAWRGAGARMDIVDLGVPDDGGLQADGVGQRLRAAAACAKRGLRWCGCRRRPRSACRRHAGAARPVGLAAASSPGAADEGGPVANDAHARSAGEQCRTSAPLAVMATIAEISAPPAVRSCAPTCKV